MQYGAHTMQQHQYHSEMIVFLTQTSNNVLLTKSCTYLPYLVLNGFKTQYRIQQYTSISTHLEKVWMWVSTDPTRLVSSSTSSTQEGHQSLPICRVRSTDSTIGSYLVLAATRWNKQGTINWCIETDKIENGRKNWINFDTILQKSSGPEGKVFICGFHQVWGQKESISFSGRTQKTVVRPW